MTRLYKVSLSLALALFALSSCGKGTPDPVDIDDFQVTGWIGAVGGPNDACSTVHTNTTLPPVHHTMAQCQAMLPGMILIKGSDFNKLVAGRDKLCTETGSCNYLEAMIAQKMRAVVKQIQRINPFRE